MTTGYRPKGGRRPEDFPAARIRDEQIMNLLRRNPDGLTRNEIATALGLRDLPRLITYALTRLRLAGRVDHWSEGCEGHGYWTRSIKEVMKGRET